MDWIIYTPYFLLIIVRVTSFLATIPIFSYRNIPIIHKIGLSLFMSIFIAVSIEPIVIAVDGMFFLLIIKEIIVGLSIGLVATIIVYAFQVAGGFIDLQMGFAIANVFDPQTGVQSPLIGKYLYTFAIMFLLAIDAHHMFLNGLVTSFQFIPIDEWTAAAALYSGSVSSLILDVFIEMFLISFQMAIPIVGCLFLVDLALGIVNRTVPQLNVFVVGLPLKILVSFLVLLFILPMFYGTIGDIYSEISEAIQKMIVILGGK